jgi:hypothetical protein
VRDASPNTEIGEHATGHRLGYEHIPKPVHDWQAIRAARIDPSGMRHSWAEVLDETIFEVVGLIGGNNAGSITYFHAPFAWFLQDAYEAFSGALQLPPFNCHQLSK